ncbi:unnamed protein product [Lactuca virosa]|uniref:Uncharacterized protein n=1 Tax=Lactuca virosa TaxID=75947 RepID=A0AAU9NN70_9ASTR|nr:unnamed protein product [Lactuca virosa]
MGELSFICTDFGRTICRAKGLSSL